MLRNRRLSRPVVLSICLSILILVVAAGLLTWHLLTQPPTPPRATCGILSFPPGPSPHTQQVLDCFYRAYQQCDAMTMQVTEHGTDTGNTTIYWPQRVGNTCQIIAESNSYTLVRGDTSSTETCQSVIPKDGGLLLQRCSTSGNIFITEHGVQGQ